MYIDKEETLCQKKLKIKKIEECEKENLEIQGQSGDCWHDCKTWYGNTTTPKCEYTHTAHDNWFL